MESLLASYGSDDEENPSGSPVRVVETRDPDVSRQTLVNSQQRTNLALETFSWNNRGTLLRSWERNSGEHGGGSGAETGPENYGAGALPSPSHSEWRAYSVRSYGASPQPKNGARAANKDGDSIPLLCTPVSTSLASEVVRDSTVPQVSEETSAAWNSPGKLPTKSTSMTGGLPPKPFRSLFEKLPSPSISRPPAIMSKKVIDFRPPVNWALLGNSEDDDFEANTKRAKVSTERGGTKNRPADNLCALLPPPKNNLGPRAALRSVDVHGGRRAMIEPPTDSSKTVLEMNSSPGHLVQKESSRTVGLGELNDGTNPAVEIPGPAVENELPLRPIYAPSSQSDNSYRDQHPRSSQGPYVQSLLGNRDVSSGGSPVAFGFHSTVSEGPAPHVLAELTKDRRKRQDELPPEMIEVKQADLTGGSKLREDQLRTTGIAFGPSYKPPASAKDKPSKLHRRKHQLGALYFDMKQNEMNLLERRLKGSLTKAETQAKYGW